MKKFYSILGLALGMLAVACSTDSTQDVLPLPQNEVVLGVSLEDSSRTQIGKEIPGGYTVVWSEGDRLAVNDKFSSEVPAEYVGAKGARFTVQDVTAPYHIFYPAEAVKGYDAENDCFVVYSPSEQEYTDKSFADKIAIMAGVAEEAGQPITLTHLFSFIKVSIAKGDNVVLHSVTIESLDEATMSGELWIAPGDTESWALGCDYIHIVGKDGIPYNNGVAEVIFAVPAREYDNGFKVTIEDKTGKAMSRTAYTTNGVKLKGGEVLAMPTLTYKGEAQKGIVIRTAADLVAFHAAAKAGDYSAYLNDEDEVVLGADIDMTGIDWEWTAGDFAGTFNGKGYKIKNWKADRPLFCNVTGTIKNIIIDKTCTFTAATESMTATGDKQCAFIAEKIFPAGEAINCTNFGDVTASEINNGTHRVAGLFGAGYGLIADCRNYGNITVTNNKDFTKNLMVGGVVAYYNTNFSPKDYFGKDFLYNCTNYGNITVEFPETVQPKNVYVGGVLGTTAYHKTAEVVNHGRITDCYNFGNVKYHFKKLATGTYGNVGGVIGYAEANIQYCYNYGKVEYTVPVGERTVGGTRPGVGGVVATATHTVFYCENYGEVYVEGVWSGGTEGNAGAGSYGGAVFGGVVGCAGITDVTDSTDKVKNCTNYGKFTTKYYCLATGGTATSQGGVVGYSQMAVEDCSNEGEVDINTYNKNSYVGGVVGNSPYNVTGCNNNGSVSLTLMGMTAVDAAFRAGGVVGYCPKTISDCHNTGTVTTKANGVDKDEINIYTASVVGLGGQTITGCTNSGTYQTTICKGDVKYNTLYSGGVVGCANTITNCETSGSSKVEVQDGALIGTLYTGGIVGYGNTSVSGCTFSGSHALTTQNPKGTLRCAGIVGQIKTISGTVASIQDCSSTAGASVSLSCKNTSPNYVGGIIGMSNNGVKNCDNAATISVKFIKKFTSESITYIGGVAGRQCQEMTGCDNTGSITADFLGSTMPLYAGGVLGHNYKETSTMKTCTNSGNVTITNAGNTENISGMAGLNDGTIDATCTNTGVVSVNGEVK